MSSLGSPMFPHRPRPELETFAESIENSKKAKASADPNEKAGFIDMLSDHGGKVALAVVGGLIALFYSYYASGKDRNRLEENIAEAAMLEPYEIQELRFRNKVDRDTFSAVVLQSKDRFPAGTTTYAEFIHFLKAELVLPEDSPSPGSAPAEDRGSVVDVNTGFFGMPFAAATPSTPSSTERPAAGLRKLSLKSMHLLDRVIMGHCLSLAQHQHSAPNSNSSSSSDNNHNASVFAAIHATHTSDSDAAVPVSWTDTPLDLDLLLVAFSLTMVPDAEARVYGLYEIAQRATGEAQHAPSESNSSNNSVENATGDSGNGVDTISRGTVNLFVCAVLL